MDIEIYAEIIRETEKALLIFDGADEVWLPKSQIYVQPFKGNDCQITLPEWLAREKEII